MPIYDYVCSNCTTRTEFIHGIEAPAPRFCPTCGAEGTLRKAVSAPSVHFRGSGWAKKDRSTAATSKTKAAAAAGSGESSTGSGESSTGSSGHDAKSASSDSTSSPKKTTDSSPPKSAPTSASSEG